ncbi:MAG: hypothetical protein CME63_05105 [Halobacteriovoraceae bacterium]|nr:hypothetical protein [Halobacteriovoraceae bacterium]MBC97104.1 hypothetical protein [Halobacteriovoraceae bacterium]|tara:strand:+ start:52530 stop:52811 length:282 start_codon:yes stop_codon:yes gene_type:complete
MPNSVEAHTPETLEVDVDHFTALYAMALQGTLGPDEEDEILEVASHCMNSDDLDPATRDFFQSAFFVINKKNKRFIDLRKMNQMVKNGEIGRH